VSRQNLRQRRKLEQQIERAQPTARQSARSGLLGGENPHGYQLNAAGEPICNACKHCTNAAYVRTPDLVCWNCGSPLTPNSGYCPVCRRDRPSLPAPAEGTCSHCYNHLQLLPVQHRKHTEISPWAVLGVVVLLIVVGGIAGAIV